MAKDFKLAVNEGKLKVTNLSQFFKQHMNMLLQEIRSLRQQVSSQTNRIKELELELITDPLTKLYNRRFLEEKNGYFIFIDCDNFKSINDVHGHEIGDRALIAVADALKQHVREGDVVRFAGDEFVILLEHISCEKEAKYITTRLEQDIPFVQVENLQGEKIQFGLSMGVGSELKSADKAMYEAKSRRKLYDGISQKNISTAI